MADDPLVVPVGDISPENVAYTLMRDIAIVERKSFSPLPGEGFTSVDRRWILDTYAECLQATKGVRG